MLIKAKAELIQSQRSFLLKNDNCACMEDGSFNLLTAAPNCLNKKNHEWPIKSDHFDINLYYCMYDETF